MQRFIECGHISAPVRGTRPSQPERKTVTQETISDIGSAPTAGRRIW